MITRSSKVTTYLLKTAIRNQTHYIAPKDLSSHKPAGGYKASRSVRVTSKQDSKHKWEVQWGVYIQMWSVRKSPRSAWQHLVLD